jgi:phosphate transport system protein
LDQPREEEPILDGEPVRELRLDYHDRIAEVREQSLSVLSRAVDATDAASRVLVAKGTSTEETGGDVEESQRIAAAVDAEVVALLALESPVARDLRTILASRDVTQIALLCAGLAAALGGRVRRVAGSLTDELCGLAGEVGTRTVDLLRAAEAAWAGLDLELASDVPAEATRVRRVQTEFITALLGLRGVAMESALDVALVARAYERLADHAVEVAERVLFAVRGTPASVPES